MIEPWIGADITLFETKIPEDNLLKAEELFDQKSFSKIKQVTKNNWEVIIIDNNIHYSSHVTLKGDKITKAVCNCTNFSTSNFCGHLGASLLLIRKERDIKDQKSISKSTRKTTAKPIAINTLLSSLTKNELVEFVTAKARNDKAFKLLLQARFVEKLNEGQLEKFVESTFPIFTKANEKVAPAKLRVFVEITNELIIHFKSLIAKADYTKAYRLSFLILKKSFYIKYHLKNDNATFFKLHSTLLGNYIEVFKLIEAPEFKEVIFKDLNQLLSTSYISAATIPEKKLWTTLYQEASYHPQLLEISENFISRLPYKDFDSVYFVKMLELLLQPTKEERAASIQNKDLQECYRIIQNLQTFKDLPNAAEALVTFYTAKNLNRPLALSILSVLDLGGYVNKEIIDRSVHFYIQFQDNSFLAFIEKHDPKWPKSMKAIEAAINSKNKPNLLIQFYDFTDQKDQFFSKIEEVLTYPLVKEFDDRMLELNEDKCMDIYFNLLEQYLQEHFGIVAKEYTTDVFRRTEYIADKQWTNKLKSRLKDRFPDKKLIFS